MAGLIRCKACGYVTREGRIKDVCPACGVPAKMFEPYNDPVSEKRRTILDLHIHPVLVHFPQAFSFTLLGLAVSYYIAPFAVKDSLYYTLKVLSFFLPFFVVIAFLTGLLDGKIRFRKVTTAFLEVKIIVGSTLFFISIGLAVLAFAEPFAAGYFTLLAVIAAGCAAVLGFIGGRLIEAKFPG